MNAKLTMAAAVLALLLVGGCEGAAEGEKAAETQASSALQRKPGLWKQTMLAEGQDAIQSVLICLDSATDRQLSWWGNRDGCAQNSLERRPDGSWAFASDCKLEPEGRVKVQGRVVGDPSSRYQLQATTTASGNADPAMNGSREVTVDAAWQGPCPSSLRPGEMQLPSGRKVMAAAGITG